MTSSVDMADIDLVFSESEKAQLLQQFEAQGYVLLPQAIPLETVIATAFPIYTGCIPIFSRRWAMPGLWPP
jgi:hypothetical protein